MCYFTPFNQLIAVCAEKSTASKAYTCHIRIVKNAEPLGAPLSTRCTECDKDAVSDSHLDTILKAAEMSLNPPSQAVQENDPPSGEYQSTVVVDHVGKKRCARSAHSSHSGLYNAIRKPSDTISAIIGELAHTMSTDHTNGDTRNPQRTTCVGPGAERSPPEDSPYGFENFVPLPSS
jgi:hypothetical protein